VVLEYAQPVEVEETYEKWGHQVPLRLQFPTATKVPRDHEHAEDQKGASLKRVEQTLASSVTSSHLDRHRRLRQSLREVRSRLVMLAWVGQDLGD